MRNGFLVSLLAMFSLAGLVSAQPPSSGDLGVTLGRPIPLLPKVSKPTPALTAGSPSRPLAPAVANGGATKPCAYEEPVRKVSNSAAPATAGSPPAVIVFAQPPYYSGKSYFLPEVPVPLPHEFTNPAASPTGSSLVSTSGQSASTGFSETVRRVGPAFLSGASSPSASPPLQRLVPTAAGCCERAPCACVDLCAPVRAPCGPPGRVWASAEYLLWWIEGGRVPPLVTTGPPASAGVLGAPGTTVLFGGSRLDEEAHSGGRFTLGYWLNECQTFGLEAEYFFLGSHATEFTAGGPGLPGSQVIARPFVNVLTGGETAELVNFPAALAGNIHVSSSSRLEGAGISGLANLWCACCYRVDLLAGFRYLELREGIGINENLALNPSVPTIGGSMLAVADQFDTRNRFYGGQLGVRTEYRWGRVFLDLTGSLALGTNHEDIDIHGSTVIRPVGGPPTTLAGGILALPSNSGHFSRDRFAVVPEVGINLGYQVTRHLRAFVGYGFLYANHVARPGNSIDRVVNLSQVPSNLAPGTLTGPARPALVLRDTDFWAQGINLGLEILY